LSIAVGSNVSYGPYVMDRASQTRYHKEGGWHTIQDVAEENADRVAEIIMQSVNKAMKER